jgi:hypothetical protein
MAKEKEKYFGSTQAELDHYFGNEVGGVLMEMQNIAEGLEQPGDVTKFYSKKRANFLKGLQNAIDKHLPIKGKVTYKKLRKIIKLAEEKDWSEPEGIRQICGMYEQIRYGKKTNEYTHLLETLKSKFKEN